MSDCCNIEIRYDATNKSFALYKDGVKSGDDVPFPYDELCDAVKDKVLSEMEPIKPTGMSITDNGDGTFDLITTFDNGSSYTVTTTDLTGPAGDSPTEAEIINIITTNNLSGIPVGFQGFYLGDADNFDATGLGKPGTDVSGWAIPNGNDGRPNLLLGRSIRLMDPANVNFDTVLETGGNDFIIIDKTNIPIAPSHTISTGVLTHDLAPDRFLVNGNNRGTAIASGGSDAISGDAIQTDGINDHDASDIDIDNNTGGGQQLNMTNKYVVLLPIVKI